MAGPLDLPKNGPGDDVAGGEFGIAVLAHEEAFARFVPEHCSLAADRLRDEVPGRPLPPEDRRMELDELHVGEQRPRPKRDGNPLARGDGGVRALAVEAAGAPGREDHGPGFDLLDRLPPIARYEGDDTVPAGPPESSERGALAHLDAGVQDPALQGLLDRETGRVTARVKDPGPGVCRLSPEGDLPFDRIERNPVPDQVRDARRGLIREDLGGRAVHETRARPQRVREVERRRVVRSHGRGDPSLGVPSVRLFEVGLRDQRGSKAQFSAPESHIEARDSGLHDQGTPVVVAHVPRRAGCVV
jgi:hypothetical protein